ncbi:serine hydrolase domain-containing protein [uncultured Aquimarina sp.]|uniref:serine hydrolase domain-containing protein n=1 Tax=uncultured Aquimarina sp. TaxID=575652 RepID=UPI0026351025|nr:serine hydrolase domain-containing protein [uncultured Aquimarina sp.]
MIILCIGFIVFILNETKDEVNATMNNIDGKLQAFYNKKKMAGFAVSVFNTDSVIYSNGFGYADIKNNIPYTTNTIQYIASISKTTIGVSLLKAQELGLLNIDDPINKYLPFEVVNPKFPNHPITIKHLATHTSSMDYNEKVVESLYINELEKDKSLDRFIKNYFVNGNYGMVSFTNHKPGENWNYSNIGAGLAAYIIEYTSEMSFSDFTHKYIFDPLHMENTNWFEKESDSSNLSKYYVPKKNSTIVEFKTSGVQLYPARDIMTNIKDLTTYCRAILSKDHKILSNHSYEIMLNPTLNSSVTNQEVDNSGLFWMIDRNQYGITYQLTGLNGGDNCINTMMWFDPVNKLGYIFIGNTGSSKLNKVNHIWIYRTLVSLGDDILINNPKNTFSEKAKYKWHNLYNRVRGLF